MKIYFAGSVRGGRDHQAIYFEIINYLQNFGKVLTEHLGDSGLGEIGEDLEDEFIFERDMKWVEESDVIVAEVTTHSVGVGYEIGRAEAMGKDVLCLYYNEGEKHLSCMVSGNNYVNVVKYDTIEEVKKEIDNFFEKF